MNIQRHELVRSLEDPCACGATQLSRVEAYERMHWQSVSTELCQSEPALTRMGIQILGSGSAPASAAPCSGIAMRFGRMRPRRWSRAEPELKPRAKPPAPAGVEAASRRSSERTLGRVRVTDEGVTGASWRSRRSKAGDEDEDEDEEEKGRDATSGAEAARAAIGPRARVRPRPSRPAGRRSMVVLAAVGVGDGLGREEAEGKCLVEAAASDVGRGGGRALAAQATCRVGECGDSQAIEGKRQRASRWCAAVSSYASTVTGPL